MRSAITLVLLLICGPVFAQVPPGPAPRDDFQLQLAASVVATALGFIAPSALDAVTVQQLALWGLGGPAALDPSLSTELRDGSVVLMRADRTLFRRPVPPDGGADGWGDLVAEMLRAASAASPAIRAAGTQGLLNSFFDEMFNHLDPYSRYVAPAAADVDRARRSGEAGAGIQIRPSGGGFVVTDVNADGTGAEANIRVGDRIIAIDDQPVAGATLEAVQALIIGLEGTTLRMTLRSGRAAARAVEVERAVTPPETVFATRAGDLLVVRIAGFSSDTDERVARELQRNLAGARGAQVRGLVIDLRGNRGGLLRQAVTATDLMLDSGVIATTAGRNPQAAHRWTAGTGDVTGGRPAVVLVDGRSASAAEIMAAALADHGRAVVVGSATLGKGLVQTIVTLPDGGELFVSWSRVLAPGGWPLQGLGVLPQVCTSLGQAVLQTQLAALDSGTQPMAAALARHHAARAPLPAAEVLALRAPCPASEARDADMVAARFLLSHPAAYAAARLAPP